MSTRSVLIHRLFVFAMAWFLASCGGGGGGGGGVSDVTPPPPTPPVPTAPTQAAIEASLGTILQKPVMQCGTGVDALTADTAPGSTLVFETGPVRPLVLSADGQRLYVANAPANCLEIYAVEGDTLRLASTVAVGLEPVAIAERNANEVWVVNHLSDSVSVVRLDGTPRVLRTLLVGDEPRDVVFAGNNRERAFVTAAARGQNVTAPAPAPATSAGVGRAHVWVFDTTTLDDSLNGKPLAILTLFADTPRALAVSADGKTVFAAPLFSGNRSTVLHRDALGAAKPGPTKSADNVNAPGTGLIVKFDGSTWRDGFGGAWPGKVKFALPDFDVFAIDATAASPAITKQIAGVGTTLFNMAVHPTSGALYVSNTEAQNHISFEGPGTLSTTVRGRIAESRISVVNTAVGSVDAVHLNSHINFALPQGQSIPAAEKAKSLSQPTALVFSPSGDTLYTAAFGSSKVAALPTASLSTAAFSPNSAQHITVPAGPAGLAINASGSRLFVYSRFAHSVSVIDTANKATLTTRNLFTPEPARVVAGRPFLYDANLTSANGTVACSSCHVFGDMDQLAWDLGNPNETTKANPNSYVPLSPRTTTRFHPLKGPMTTQTLKGMANHGPMHWRGDRTGSNRQVVRGVQESLEEAAFKEFNGAFVDLLGRETPLAPDQLQAFTDFTMAMALPPNPIRALNNTLNAQEQAGRDIYFNTPTTLLGSCNTCHTIDRASKRFGTAGLMTFEGGRISENFKVPQLRNIYQKIGMFGASLGGTDTGPQIRGFGLSNDGSVDTLASFFSDPVFFFPQPVDVSRNAVAAFVMAMETDLPPIVGQQVTWRSSLNTVAEAQLNLFKEQATATPGRNCDLVVRITVDGSARSGMMQNDGSWLMRSGETLTEAALKQLVTATQPLTFTCVAPGMGRRIALDKI